MPSLEEYFKQNQYQAKWRIGDRVEGKWNGIPFVGSVGNDSLVNEDEGPKVSVFVDLPILYKKQIYNIITLKPKDLKVRK